MDLSKVVPYSNSRYILTTEGNVIDCKVGGVIDEVVNGVRRAKLDWVDGDRYYDVGLVVVVAMLGLKIPIDELHRVDVRYDDECASNTAPINIYYSFKEPIEVREHLGYFYIPYFSRYAINRQGDMIDLERGVLKRWYIQKPSKNDRKRRRMGYRYTNIYNDRGCGSNLSRHRALALTFKTPPSNPNKLVVNHKDGVGGNDGLDNLEWATHSDNTQHAYDNGLQPNNVRKVLIKEQATGIITEYDSITKAAKARGLPHATLSRRLNTNPGKTYTDGFAYKRDDGSEWVEGLVKERVTYGVIFRNVFTGENFVVNNQREAMDFTGVNDGTIWWHITNESMTPINGFLFREFGDEVTEWPEFDKWQLELLKRYPLKPPTGVIETDILTGEQVLYTVADLSAKLNKSTQRIRAYASSEELVKQRYRYKTVKPAGKLLRSPPGEILE